MKASRPTCATRRFDWASFDPGKGRVVLYASKLAACADMHRFVPRSELLDEYAAAAGLSRGPSKQELAHADLSRLAPERRSVIQAAVEARYESVEQVQEAVSIAAAIARQESLGPEAMELIRSSMYTKHGKEQEDRIRTAAAQRRREDIRTSARFHVSPHPVVVTPEGTEVYVGGRHDGQTEAGTIVEIKTRQRGFLGTPVYELVQLHAYMHLLDVNNAVLIESYAGEQREHGVEFDPTFWGEVLSNVATFVEKLREIDAGVTARGCANAEYTPPSP